MKLRYVNDSSPGYTRHRAGKGFTYRDTQGRRITDPAELDRIRRIGIPPAYQQVWICPYANGHIQATARDARGRKQYCYHPDWGPLRDTDKYAHLITFAKNLPRIRRHVRSHMRQPGLAREKVIASTINLLDHTLIRVGNESYARTNHSYGLTTLRNRHVRVSGQELRFQFTGKSGKTWKLLLTDRRLARIIRACQDLPGQHLLEYRDEEGKIRAVTSQDINTYLKTLTGEDITAKDFRTWAGTVLAMESLMQAEAPSSITAAKRTLSQTIKEVAARLGNTPAICRKCYIHPAVMNAYQAGRLTDLQSAGAKPSGLRRQERLVLALLERESG